MAFQVMHRQKGFLVQHGQGFARRQPHQQGPNQTGRTGGRHRIDRPPIETRFLERLGDRPINRFHVAPGSHLRHNAAVGLVEGNLRRDHIGQHLTILYDRHRRLITTCFNC